MHVLHLDIVSEGKNKLLEKIISISNHLITSLSLTSIIVGYSLRCCGNCCDSQLPWQSCAKIRCKSSEEPSFLKSSRINPHCFLCFSVISISRDSGLELMLDGITTEISSFKQSNPIWDGFKSWNVDSSEYTCNGRDEFLKNSKGSIPSHIPVSYTHLTLPTICSV